MRKTSNKVYFQLAAILVVIIGAVAYFITLKPSQEATVTPQMFAELQTKSIMQDAVSRQTQYKLAMIEKGKKQTGGKTGVYAVTASELNLRQEPGTDKAPAGQLFRGSKITVIDSTDPSWYKVDISNTTIEALDNNGSLLLLKREGQEFARVDAKLWNVGATNKHYYVAVQYLANAIEEIPSAPANPQKPFTYGLLFYNPAAASLLEQMVWKEASAELRAAGFDGVKVVRVPDGKERTIKFVDDTKAGKYQAAESAPGDFVKARQDGAAVEAFAKNSNKNDAARVDYEGLLIVNKKKGIYSIAQLKGKTVLTGPPGSESSYVYQTRLLKNKFKLEATKDYFVETGYGHREIFLRVATGMADAGIVGDFVMFSDPLYVFGRDAAKLSIPLTSAQKLKELREEVLILPLSGDKIPSNPHVIQTVIMREHPILADKIFKAVKECYDNNREDFGIEKAKTEDYSVLSI